MTLDSTGDAGPQSICDVNDNADSPDSISSSASPAAIVIPENSLAEVNVPEMDMSAEDASELSKSKSTRRANTAERRATHNAVERQRRETLNGRFLQLARLLPNLSPIRRPSKSSIVNSSLAYIHASQRHRLLASRVCSALAAECDIVASERDSLRRELNEWRDRAGLPRIRARYSEKNRGEAYKVVVGGELDVVMAVGGEDGEDEAENKYGGYSIGGDINMDLFPDTSLNSDRNLFPPSRHSQSSHSHSCSSHVHQRHSYHRGHRADSVSIAMPSDTVSFENPAMSFNMNANTGIFDPNSLLDGLSCMQNDKYQSTYENDALSLFVAPSTFSLDWNHSRPNTRSSTARTNKLRRSSMTGLNPNPKIDEFAHAQALQALQAQSRSYKASENESGSPAGSVSSSSMGRARSRSATSDYESSSWSPSHEERYDTLAMMSGPSVNQTERGFEMSI